MEAQGMKMEITSDPVGSGELMDTSGSVVNASESAHMIGPGDIDFSGIQIQEGLDQLAATNQAATGDVTHAMITADGQAVAVTLDPETGQYVTADGQTFMVQDPNQDGTHLAVPEVQAKSEITSDLSSLAEAAEHHVMVDMGAESNASKFQVPTVGQLPPENVLSTTNPSTISTTDTITTTSGYIHDDPYTFAEQNDKVIKKDPSFKVANSDGGLVEPQPPQQSFRIMGQDGNVVHSEQQQVLRIINSDGTVSSLGNSQVRQVSPQIKVLNADGTLSTYTGGNIRVVQQEQQPKVRVVQAGSGSPVKTTMTLSQAQQLGIIPPGASNVKILPKSPVKTVRKSDGRTVIVQSPQKQQVVIKSGPRYIQPNTSGASVSGQQQVIRIPASAAGTPGPGTIKKIQIGNTVQYVRVISSNQAEKQKVNSQASVKGVQPILPSIVRTTDGGTKVVKLQVPSSVRQMVTPRSILPSSQASAFSKVDGDSPEVEMQDEVEELDYKPHYKSNSNKQSSGNVATFEASGVRPRKPCNCTKSQCLKLYCDCFANGEFCNNCNCTNCFNNIKFEKQRQKSIKQCLDRNPAAFKPKIGRLATDGERRHNRGCNCKRSGCLKNYCECYEAKIPCTENCKCIGCKNIDEEMPTDPDVKPGENSSNPVKMLLAAHRRSEIRPSLKAKLAPLNSLQQADGKQPFSFVTSDVVEATCQCLLAQAEEAEAKNQTQEEAESMIIDEFGRCLKQIIDMANKAAAAATIKAEHG